MPAASDIQSIVLIAIVILTARSDVGTLRISNKMVTLTCLSGLLFNASLGWNQAQWNGCYHAGVFSFLGVLSGFFLLLPLYMLGGMTAGDVKWLGALGAWYGPRGTLALFLISGLFLGIISLGLALNLKFRRSSIDRGSRKSNVDEVFIEPDHRLRLIPYAAPVAIAVCGVELWRLFH